MEPFLNTIALTQTLPCLAEPGKIVVRGRPSRPLDEVIPYLATLPNIISFNPVTLTLTFRRRPGFLTLYPDKVYITQVKDLDEGLMLLGAFVMGIVVALTTSLPGMIAIAKSNISGFKDGRWIYDKFVRPARVDLEKVGAHYAISSLFGEAPEGSMTYSFFVEREDYRSQQVGKTKMAVGRVRVTSSVTYETALLVFAVLHMGDHNLSGGVRWYQNPAAYETLVQEFQKGFSRSDFPEFIRAMDRSFGSSIYSLKSLFRDQQRHILDSILENTLAGAESA